MSRIRRQSQSGAVETDDAAIPVYGISDLHLFVDGDDGRLQGGPAYSPVPPVLIERL